MPIVKLLERLVPSFEISETPARRKHDCRQEQRRVWIADKLAIKGFNEQNVKPEFAILVLLVPCQDSTVYPAVLAATPKRDVIRRRVFERSRQANVSL